MVNYLRSLQMDCWCDCDSPYHVVWNKPYRGKSGRTRGGYGSKIPTDKVVLLWGSRREYRVYAICFSNCASHYIICNKQRLYLR